MKSFQDKCQAYKGKDFASSSPEDKKTIVESIIADKDDSTDLKYFFKTVKGLTIQSYTASEFFMTKVQVYELIPGRYHGCVPA